MLIIYKHFTALFIHLVFLLFNRSFISLIAKSLSFLKSLYSLLHKDRFNQIKNKQIK